MFEGNLTTEAPNEQGEAGQLRAFDWTELVARLGASRDLRATIARRSTPSGGNFARFGKVAAVDVNENGSRVNPNTLAHGKALEGIESSTLKKRNKATES